MQMMKESPTRATVGPPLSTEFSRGVGEVADEICEAAGVSAQGAPPRLSSAAQVERCTRHPDSQDHGARRPTACRPIGEELLRPAGLEQPGRGRFFDRRHAPARRLSRQPVPGRGRPGLRRRACRRGAGRAVPLRQPRAAAVPAVGLRDHQGRDDVDWQRLRAAAVARARCPSGPLVAPRAHRLGLGAVHLGVQGGGRHYPEIIKELRLG